MGDWADEKAPQLRADVLNAVDNRQGVELGTCDDADNLIAQALRDAVPNWEQALSEVDETARREEREAWKPVLDEIERITWREGDGMAAATQALQDIRKIVKAIRERKDD